MKKTPFEQFLSDRAIPDDSEIAPILKAAWDTAIETITRHADDLKAPEWV